MRLGGSKEPGRVNEVRRWEVCEGGFSESLEHWVDTDDAGVGDGAYPRTHK